MRTTESADSEYSPSMGDILDHYEELSETVSRDPSVAADNRRLADLALGRAKAEARAEGTRAAYWDRKHGGITPNPYAPGDQ